MANAKNMDLLSGSIWDKILMFAMPLAASSIFQQLFNSADVAVVGKFAGDAALAAVGANTFIINLMVNLFVGLSIGANVVVANALGERSTRVVSRGVHTSIAVSIVCGILLSVVGIVFARSILSAIATPSDILDAAVLYFRIYFVGMPFIMLYNFCAAILRSKGDTKRPFYVLLVSGAINLALNIIFVVGFHMDVDGVAIATVIANVISSLAVLYFLMHEVGPFKFEFWKLRVTPFILSRIIKIGLPAGVQGALFSFSNVCIQSAINSLGSTAVAASAVAMNPELIVYFWLASFGHACVTFVGQNYGARNLERCRKVVRWTIFLSGLSTFTLGALTCLFYHPILSIFTNDESVIATGAYRVFIVIGLEFINVLIDVTSGALRGMGKSMLPTLICVFGICGVRISWVFFMFPKFGTFKALMLCYPISWLTAGTILVCVYMVFVRKTRMEWAKDS
ncbi:MAG: MATE family efflux transporter [Fibrobacter sp.]|nr:MATE family efflux transporter [Fibrobacter sp.]